MQETIGDNPSGAKRRDLSDEDEQGSNHPHGHRMLWTVAVLILAGGIAAGAYGSLKLLPAMQDRIVTVGRRIHAVDEALRSWTTSQRDAWAKRLSGVKARVDGTLGTTRKQAEEIAVRTPQHMQTLDERIENLQAKVDGIQSAQQSIDTRLSGLQEQLNQIQATNGQEMERLRDELLQSMNAEDATLASLTRRIASIDERSGQSQSDLESLPRKVDRERIGFEVSVNHDRELAPGIDMDVSHTDVSHQRFDGWVRLMPDRRTIWIHGRGLQQPLVFYSRGDDRPREVVVTRVTKDAVVGYLLEPRQNAASD